MAFRRVIFNGENIKDVKENVESLFDSHKFQQDYAGVKTTIKPGVKPDVLVVDLNGEGADSVSRKLKDIGNKFKVATKIRNEIKLAPVKEGTGKLTSNSGQLASDEDIEIIKNKLENLKKQYPNWKFNVSSLNNEINFKNKISYSSNNTSDKESKEVINKIRTTFIKEETQSKPIQLKGGFSFPMLTKGDKIKYFNSPLPLEIISVGNDSAAVINPKGKTIEIKSLKGWEPVSVKSLKEETKEPIQKTQVLGLVRAKQVTKELIDKGFIPGKDFSVVQDFKNKKMFNFNPILKEEIQNDEFDFIKRNFPKATIDGPKYANREGQYVLNILGDTQKDPKTNIIFKPEGGKYLVQRIQGYGINPKNAAAFGLTDYGRTGYAGLDSYYKDGNYNPVVMDKQRFLGLCHLVNDGFSSEAKSQGDFYRNRGNTSGTIDEGKIKVSELKSIIKEEINNFIKESQKYNWIDISKEVPKIGQKIKYQGNLEEPNEGIFKGIKNKGDDKVGVVKIKNGEDLFDKWF